MSWQTTICNEVNGLLNSESMSDVKLTVGKEPNRKVFRSHKLLLGIFSEVFKSMLFDSLAEKKNEIELPEDDPDAFQIMLNYIYTGKENMESAPIMIEVCRLASKYMIHQLKKNSAEYLEKQISSESAIQIHEMATELMEHKLRLKSRFYIQKYAKNVLESKSFFNSEISTIKRIFSSDHLNVPTELFIYTAILQWGEEQCKRTGKEVNESNIRKIITPLLPEIRFLAMTTKEFLTGPGKGTILTSAEQLSIIRNIALTESDEIPNVGNSIKIKRCFVHLGIRVSNEPKRELSSNKPKRELSSDSSSTVIRCSEPFTMNVYIYGVMLCALNCLELSDVECILTIRNVTRETKISKILTEFEKFGKNLFLETDEQLFVGESDECEISIEGKYFNPKDLYYCIWMV